MSYYKYQMDVVRLCTTDVDNRKKKYFFFKNIWSIQKKEVPLQANFG